ncbi:hypothetical protein EYF80_058172 [Liparis tanakae]|uniref:Uncharacterized protein n=1 Tax=Liparis tanakae TaxID=230148 RepID=A0A4Z2ESR2_9TELE|nr:hypothetical protein EYF80_058172 [Liparis tanakae]
MTADCGTGSCDLGTPARTSTPPAGLRHWPFKKKHFDRRCHKSSFSACRFIFGEDDEAREDEVIIFGAPYLERRIWSAVETPYPSLVSTCRPLWLRPRGRPALWSV